MEFETIKKSELGKSIWKYFLKTSKSPNLIYSTRNEFYLWMNNKIPVSLLDHNKILYFDEEIYQQITQFFCLDRDDLTECLKSYFNDILGLDIDKIDLF